MCQNNDLNIKKKKVKTWILKTKVGNNVKKKIPITLIGQWNKNPKSNLPFLKKKLTNCLNEVNCKPS